MSDVPPKPQADATASDLTDRQLQVLKAITTYQNERGFVPSFREIGAAAGLKSPSSVKHQLQTLEDKGYIRLNANKGRAVEILHDPFSEKASVANRAEGDSRRDMATIIPFPSQNTSEAVLESRDIPLVGRIAAGTPITAEQHIDDVMRLPKRLTGSGGNLFMLEVHGDSMIDAAICNGDFVAALLDGEATVKTFRKDKGHVWLMPHNPAYSPIDGTYATIMGKVVTVLRKL